MDAYKYLDHHVLHKLSCTDFCHHTASENKMISQSSNDQSEGRFKSLQVLQFWTFKLIILNFQWSFQVLGDAAVLVQYKSLMTKLLNAQQLSSFIVLLFPLCIRFFFPGMTTALSRRRVSCRELSHPDCDGWLWKKRKESSVFIAQKWQRFWFVLKGPNLYWYTSQQVGKEYGLKKCCYLNVFFCKFDLCLHTFFLVFIKKSLLGILFLSHGGVFSEY